MVVEDQAVIALDLADAMAAQGYEVLPPAHSVADALAVLERDVPDFAIVDVHLGRGEGGEDLLPLLERMGCRCVIFSGIDDACERLAAAYPQFAVVRKPARSRALVGALERLARTGQDALARAAAPRGRDVPIL